MWKHGDRVRVRAERIDPMRRRVEFALAELTQYGDGSLAREIS
jgi:tetrahydromethanopterin S-methyltransferase subunit G